MSQPEWELVYATDCEALYRDKTGVYEHELCVAQTIDDVDEDDIEATVAEVYRFSIDRMFRVAADEQLRDVLFSARTEGRSPEVIAEIEEQVTEWLLVEQDPMRTDLPHPITNYKPWFADDLESVARSVGRTAEEIVDDLCSDDPKRRAHAYDDIGGYHGFMNFDHDPERWSESEFKEWPECGESLSNEERDDFVRGHMMCALSDVMRYVHEDTCPCAEHVENGDPYDADTCTCEGEGPDIQPSSDQHDEESLDDETRAEMEIDAQNFYEANVVDLRASKLDMNTLGRDFWYTRNGHGTGFWDHYNKSTPEGEACERLSKASKPYGSMNLIEDADMKVRKM